MRKVLKVYRDKDSKDKKCNKELIMMLPDQNISLSIEQDSNGLYNYTYEENTRKDSTQYND